MASSKRRLVIVESPAKAKKIGSYLGPGYRVMASVGHIRDLPGKAAEIPAEVKKEPWATLGVNVDRDFEPLYVVPAEKKKTVKELKDALKEADELIIATDEDREGESIGWHLVELLKPKVPVKRMVFDEITKEAIQGAVKNTRDLDTNLVAAQETRRIVDRLYGYTLSPLLWKKIAPKLSAGRVQSVAVRMIVQRELERLAFRVSVYWDTRARLTTEEGLAFFVDLVTSGGQQVAQGRDFDPATGRLKEGSTTLWLDEKQATAIAVDSRSRQWSVREVEHKKQTRKAPAPFTTSTLQQEANSRLRMTARQTMSVAQRLYEDGLITYMRTDSTHLSDEAMKAARTIIEREYVPKDPRYYVGPRTYVSKARNAQEAHEAIRPAGSSWVKPSQSGLQGQEAALYNLIYSRAVASQIADAEMTYTTALIGAGDHVYKGTGRHIDFYGFLRAYPEHGNQESYLPPLTKDEQVKPTPDDEWPEAVVPVRHETKPPARFTEASLVRRMEQEGIGRPSTYASIIGTIQDRGYVEKQGNQLVPTFTAMAVNRLLERYFPDLVDYGFTADMEQKLDDIAAGQQDRLPYLDRFYRGEQGIAPQVKAKEAEIDPRDACTLRLDGVTSDIRIGKFGPYFEKETDGKKVTASIPATVAPADLSEELAAKLIQDKERGPQALGTHAETGLPIYVKAGPFGPYLQLGDVTDENPKPKRTSIPNTFRPDELTPEQATELLALPRRLGHHPETGKVVNVGIGRFGPYVLHDKKYGNFEKKTHTFEWDGKTYDVLSVTLPVAVEMLARSKTRAAPTPLKDLGVHPEDKQPVQIFEGRYGPYVKHGKTNATIPKDRDPQEVTLEEAVVMLAEKAARPSTGRKRGGGGRKKK